MSVAGVDTDKTSPLPRMPDRRLILFAKPPLPGRVKTRLAADIGHARASCHYRQMLRTLQRRLGADARWQTHVCQAGPGRLPLARCPTTLQSSGNLGRRIAAALADHHEHDVLIVGTDVPDICTDDIAAGFAALRRADLVFGPAVDGGFWLIGARAGRGRQLRLGTVRWSSPHTLRDTVQIVRGRHSVAWLRTLRDIDTQADLNAWQRGDPLPAKVAQLNPQPAATTEPDVRSRPARPLDAA